MKIKVDEKSGILKLADEQKPIDAVVETKSIDSDEDIGKLLADAEELTKNITLARRNLEDDILKYAGINIKVAKTEEEKEKKEVEKEVRKHEKDMDQNVENLDSLISELNDLVKRIDSAIKKKGPKLSPSELKGSDKIKDDAESEIEKSDKVLEEADESMLKKKMQEKKPFPAKKEEEKKEPEMPPKKSSALTDAEKKSAEAIIDQSTITDKPATKEKLALAENNDEAMKIISDAGKTASDQRSASMEKKAESPVMFSDAGNKKDYGRSKSPDVSQAKKEFTGNNDFYKWEENKLDRKWLVAQINTVSNNKLAKFKRSLELSGEAMLKDINVDPLKVALKKNFVDAGVSEKVASVIIDNSFIESAQDSVEQLMKRAEELYGLDNIRFVEAKMKINKYVPADGTSEQKIATVEKTASKQESEKIVSTVVSGVGSEEVNGQIDYSRIFDADRPAGAIK